MLPIKEIKHIEFPEDCDVKEAIKAALYFCRDNRCSVRFELKEKEVKISYAENIDISEQCEKYFSIFYAPFTKEEKSNFFNLLNMQIIIKAKDGRRIYTNCRLRKRNIWERSMSEPERQEAEYVIYVPIIVGIEVDDECIINQKIYKIIFINEVGEWLCLSAREIYNG